MPHFERPTKLPEPWPLFRAQVRHRWLYPFLYTEWLLRHAAYYLGRWSLLEVLEYVGSFSILIAVILYFAEIGERRQQKHYQAWQVINTAQGKGGNGGRIDALEQLNSDGIALTGVDVTDAFLQNVHLDRAELRRATLSGADMRMAHLRGAKLADAAMKFTNLRGADLRDADLSGCDMTNADLTGADLRGAIVNGAKFAGVDLTEADIGESKGWDSVVSIHEVIAHDIKEPPDAFRRAIEPVSPPAIAPAPTAPPATTSSTNPA